MKSSNLHLKGVPGAPAAFPVKLKAFVSRGYDQALRWDTTQLPVQAAWPDDAVGLTGSQVGGGPLAILSSPVTRAVEDKLPLPLAWKERGGSFPVSFPVFLWKLRWPLRAQSRRAVLPWRGSSVG